MHGDERERGHRVAAAGEQVDGSGAEGVDHGSHVAGLDLGIAFDLPVLADATTAATRPADSGRVRAVPREVGVRIDR